MPQWYISLLGIRECINVPLFSDFASGLTSTPLFVLCKMYFGTLVLTAIKGELLHIS